MIYFDTSYIIKCYLPEPHHQVVRSLAGQQQGIGCCVLGMAEFFTAVKRHVREGKLGERQAQGVFQLMRRESAAGAWVWFPITHNLVERACLTVEKAPRNVFLRAGDALQLACAQEQGFAEIHSNDRHLLAAAPLFGLKGSNIIP